MHHKKYSLDLKPPSKYTQNTNYHKPKSYMINNNNNNANDNLNNISKMIGATRISQSSLFQQSLPLINMKNSAKTRRQAYSNTYKNTNYQRKLSLYQKNNQQHHQQFYLPSIINRSSNNNKNKNNNFSILTNNNNPEQKSLSKLNISSIISSQQQTKQQQQKPRNNNLFLLPLYYQSLVYHSLISTQSANHHNINNNHNNNSNNYLSTLATNHFQQCIQALKVGKQIIKSTTPPEKQLKLTKKNPKLKTVYLDLDQTLIHCDESATSYTVKLNFPIENTNQTISAGIRVRPYCRQFLQQLAKIAQIIIFTASSQSYADVILEYLDPQNKIFSHRLYRHHCKLQKGYYTKDLRLVTNRRLQDCLLVDNSAHCYMMQPYNGVPIIPFYHYLKDKQLLSLLKWLKQALKQDDVRHAVRRSFFWNKYFQNDNDPKKIFITHYQSVLL